MYKLTKSPKKDKKFRVTLPNGRTINFGAKGYSNYTIHKDAARMKRYLTRHRSTENWTKPNSAGFWARWVLWSEPSLQAAIRRTEKKLGARIIFIP